jgi:hypothetical protein
VCDPVERPVPTLVAAPSCAERKRAWTDLAADPSDPARPAVTRRGVTRCKDGVARWLSISTFLRCHRVLRDGVEMPLVTQRDPITTRMTLRSVIATGLPCPRYARGVPIHPTENENPP